MVIAAYRLPTEEKYLAQGLTLTLIVTSSFNSPILDAAEGHWFAILFAVCFSPLSTRVLSTLELKPVESLVRS